MNDVLEKVKIWLEQEAEGQEVIDEYKGGLRPKCTDGTDDIIEGRVESANALLEQIKKWEAGDEIKTCIDCGKSPLVFECETEEDEAYEPDPETGDPRCFSCDLKANPTRWVEEVSDE